MLVSQRNRPNAVSNRTNDPLVSPITTADFAEFIGVDDSPFLDTFLLAACQYYINDSNNELLSRDYVQRLDRFPQESESYGGISPYYGDLKPWISLLVYPVSVLTSVVVSETDVTSDVELDQFAKPCRLIFDTIYLDVRNTFNDIEITYSAGYATASEIPANVILAIMMLAAYLYEHRGECSVDDAAMNSGARGMWSQDSILLSL